MKRRALLVAGVFLALACNQDTPLQPAPPTAPPPPPPPPATNRPPTAVLRVSWQGQEGVASAGFTADGSSDPDGDSLYYGWDWGDGNSITGTNVQQTHDYIDNGTYTVVLTVTDTHGDVGTANARVTISNATPYISAAQLSAPPLPASVPMTAIVHVQYADAGPADNPVLTVDWGDGVSSRDTVHVYRTPGAYAIKLTVTDKDGASSSQQLSRNVWVYDPLPSRSIPGYEVVDLGTLGGDEAVPGAFNNRAEIVGSSTLGNGSRHAFLWRDGVMTDISPAGQNIESAVRISDAGVIAGERHAEFDAEMPMWKDGVFTGFASVPSSEFGPVPVKIMESGDVLLNINKHEYPTAVLLRNGTAVTIGSFYSSSNGHSWATDMNTRGQVVGSGAYQSSGAGTLDFRAFVWQDGTLTMLSSLGTAPCADIPEHQCGYSAALDIDETGHIVGAAFDGTTVRAVRWDAPGGLPQDLGFGTGTSKAVAVNERGQIAGEGGVDGGEGYFLDGGVVMTLGSLGGGGTRVAAMNENGVVVGTSKTAAGDVHAFVWTRGIGMRDLGAGPFGGLHVGTTALAVNQRGDILGYAAPCATSYGSYCASWGQTRAILWRATN